MLPLKTKLQRAQIKGIKMLRNSSYHINHSNRVVHLKWGVKRSLILPRSSCFETKTFGLLSSLPDVWALAGGWRQAEREEVSGGLESRVQIQGIHLPSPVQPTWPLQPRPSNVQRFDSEGILNLGSRSLGFGPPEASRVVPWMQGAEHQSKGYRIISCLALKSQLYVKKLMG